MSAALLANTLADVSVDFAKTLEAHRFQDYLASKEEKIASQQREIDNVKSLVDSQTAARIATTVEIARLQALLASDQPCCNNRSRTCRRSGCSSPG